jgi:hypothetical protein
MLWLYVALSLSLACPPAGGRRRTTYELRSACMLYRTAFAENICMRACMLCWHYTYIPRMQQPDKPPAICLHVRGSTTLLLLLDGRLSRTVVRLVPGYLCQPALSIRTYTRPDVTLHCTSTHVQRVPRLTDRYRPIPYYISAPVLHRSFGSKDFQRILDESNRYIGSFTKESLWIKERTPPKFLWIAILHHNFIEISISTLKSFVHSFA